MNQESIISRNDNVAYRNVDGEGLIMNPSDSMLHSLNEVACFIWEKIEESKKVSDLVGLVVNEFDCSEETASKDILDLLESLGQQKLINVE